jgi:NitT/TauT family transport system substrate-binding protein
VHGHSASTRLRALFVPLGLGVALAWGPPALAGGEMATVRVGVVRAVSDAPLYIADKKGHFERERIRVEFTHLKEMIAPLGTGQIDVAGISTSASLFNAVARGIGVFIVADKGSTPPGYGYQPLLVRSDLVTSGKVKGLSDLKGRKIAGFNKGSSSMSTLSDALAKGGLKLSDVDVVFLPFAQHVLALKNGAVDASITTEPSASEAIRSGAAVQLVRDDAIYPDHQLAVLLYGADFVKKQPDVAKRFMRAYLRGAREYNDALKDGKIGGANAAEVIAILAEYTDVKDPAVYQTITAAGVNPNGGVYMASLVKDLDFYKAQGLIQGKVSVEQATDNSFVEAALKDLGPYVRRAK